MMPQEIRLVQSSFDRLEPRAVQVAEMFFGHLFSADPSMSTMFGGDLDAQGRRLMQLIGVAVNLLDKPGQLKPVLQKLGVRLARHGVREVHCDTAGAALLRTLAEALGDAFDTETCAAWSEAHGIVSRGLIAAGQPVAAERAIATPG